jgi:hypothetical protein
MLQKIDSTVTSALSNFQIVEAALDRLLALEESERTAHYDEICQQWLSLLKHHRTATCNNLLLSKQHHIPALPETPQIILLETPEADVLRNARPHKLSKVKPVKPSMGGKGKRKATDGNEIPLEPEVGGDTPKFATTAEDRRKRRQRG